MKNRLTGILCLLTGTCIWGSAFVAQSMGMDLVGPFTFQASRCLLAVLSLLCASIFAERKTLRESFWVKWKNPHLWKTGIFCGIALFAASSLQQVGLLHTEPGKAGFLTAMYIVLVPILGLFLKKVPPKSTFFSVALAVAGLYLLSWAGTAAINVGDLLVLSSAFAFAVQILMVERWGNGLDSLRLNCIQCLVCCVLSVPFMLGEKPVMSDIFSAWLPISYAGILSMGVSYSLQITGQRYLDSAAASLIMSLESVFAVLAGWLVLHQTLSMKELLGCSLMFAAVILSQLPAGHLKKASACTE